MDYPSIHRVPQRVKNVNSEAYCPQHVSFGPYHHGKEHLKSMEEHKVRALDRFLNRLSRTDDQLMEALSKAPVDLMMACYDQLDQKWYDDREAFLRLMIRDGCFMLEILRTWMEIQTANEDAPDDPIFSSHGKVYVMPYVKRDMLMLENQLPMSVLDELVAVESHGSRSEDAESINVELIILNFYSLGSPREIDMGKCLHVLDVVRKGALLHDSDYRRPHRRIWGRTRPSKRRYSIILPSASELHEAGIHFEKSKSTCLTDVSFSRGVLSLPTIVVDDAAESMFLNLVAFELLHVRAGNEVTSYVCFMADIVKNERDSALLYTKGVILNKMRSDKAVAELFSSLSKEVTLDPESSFFVEFYVKVHAYCQKPIPLRKLRVNFIDTYCMSPWATVSLIAAILLFTLSIIQTIFTVLQYYKG